jgi:hypothetical protein
MKGNYSWFFGYSYVFYSYGYVLHLTNCSYILHLKDCGYALHLTDCSYILHLKDYGYALHLTECSLDVICYLSCLSAVELTRACHWCPSVCTGGGGVAGQHKAASARLHHAWTTCAAA